MMEQVSLNIGSIGQRLESARQAKGVSVSDAGRSTKILSKFIEAMENDDFGALSAPIYAKSFIKMYALYLGLDAQPLVDDYVKQHVSTVKPQLSDEVRQNLAAVDQLSVDSPPAAIDSETNVFSDVNHAIGTLSGSRFPLKTLLISGAGVLVLLIILFAVKQCDSGEEDVPAPAAGGAALVERTLLIERTPDAYLEKPGKIAAGLK